MRIKNLNNTGFSLLEVLLASVIFVLTIAGLFATLNAVRRPVADKESALTAAVFGKQVLESLRSSVNAQSTNFYGVCSGACPTFDLQLGTHQLSSLPAGLSWPNLPSGQSLGAAQQPPNVLTYTVSCANTGSTSSCGADVARRVDLNIKW